MEKAQGIIIAYRVRYTTSVIVNVHLSHDYCWLDCVVHEHTHVTRASLQVPRA